MAMPYVAAIDADVPAQATAATAQNWVIGEAPFAGTVTEVSVIPVAAVTANASNYRNFTVQNTGQAGAGTTTVSTMTTATTGLVVNDERLATLTGTAADLVVAAGDVLRVAETATGTGVAHGGYRVVLKISRN